LRDFGSIVVHDVAIHAVHRVLVESCAKPRLEILVDRKQVFTAEGSAPEVLDLEQEIVEIGNDRVPCGAVTVVHEDLARRLVAPALRKESAQRDADCVAMIR
jgi:hypothetical protein